MNYFDELSVAERYAKGRPYFHSKTIEKVKTYLASYPLNKVLDVACGTGLSSNALLDITDQVFATDISSEMLKFAKKNTEIYFKNAPAEKQPFLDQTFDLITVGSGVHWFNIDAFLGEAHRLLKKDAWLVLYDNFFISEMKDSPEFSNWFPDLYLEKFPSPPRDNHYNWTNEHINQLGFYLQEECYFKNDISFSKKELILYFTTQSNITDAIRKGKTTYAEVENWLDLELSQFFDKYGRQRILTFGNWIKFIQRMDKKP